MKKQILLCIMCVVALTMNAQLLDETFNYSVTNLALETTWTTAGTLTTGTGRNIISPALSYTNSGGTYVLSGLGKSMKSDISGTTDYKAYKAFTSTPVTSKVYLSFLFEAGIHPVQTQCEVFGLASDLLAGAKVWAGKGTSSTLKVRFGVTTGNTTTGNIHWGTSEFDSTAVVLVVLKHDFSTNTSTLFLNPVIGGVSEPLTNEVQDANNTLTNRTSLNNMWFRQNGTSVARYLISGARVSDSWNIAVQGGGLTAVQTINNEQNQIRSVGKSIITNQSGSLKIYSLAGSEVLSSKTEGKLTTSLSKGLYLVRFIGVQGKVQSAKVEIR
jgi:hypothetical protein